MDSTKILIVEDDEDIIEVIAYNLKKEGYKVESVLNGEDAFVMVKKVNPNLIILDLMLPGIDGLAVCKKIREDKMISSIPILMLTARSQEMDKIIGLDVGADDYMSKPFSPRELIARIKAILRRTEKHELKNKIQFKDIMIDDIKHKVKVFEKEIYLTPTEFRLLKFMAQNPGVVLSRDKILDIVFGYDSEIYQRTVDAHMKVLRKKLGQARHYIETIRGIGYKFKEREDEE